MGQVQLSYPLYWMGEKYMQLNYPLLETSTHLSTIACGAKSAQLSIHLMGHVRLSYLLLHGGQLQLNSALL
jgi:hypothetical protein